MAHGEKNGQTPSFEAERKKLKTGSTFALNNEPDSGRSFPNTPRQDVLCLQTGKCALAGLLEYLPRGEVKECAN